MSAVTAAQVKELRERTGAGMMECKKALEATGGDVQLAVEELRKTGRAKADKKASRIASEGVVFVSTTSDGKQALLIEVNSETDFVARDENFLNFVKAVAATALAAHVQDINLLSHTALVGESSTVEEARQALVAKVGENIHIRRIAWMNAEDGVGSYLHANRIGVLVKLDSHKPELAKDIAMHIAASKPLVVNPEDVSSAVVEKEKEIYLAQVAGSGKPEEIIKKMVEGRLKKFLDEVSLAGQPFVKDPNITVAALLNKHSTKVVEFTRFEVGEGIEKETEDFVAAVMSQVQGS
ncbi:MAG: tsf [Gammaproteobacteria bacterium]|jgi:elongation factor Ts|nr:tsf [Gammaproteobacteria bacterium]MCE3239025.1 tsf [Gammaproteobacteria bacterium]